MEISQQSYDKLSFFLGGIYGAYPKFESLDDVIACLCREALNTGLFVGGE